MNREGHFGLQSGSVPIHITGASHPRLPGNAVYPFLVAGGLGALAVPSPSISTLVGSVILVVLAAKFTGRRLVNAAGGTVAAITVWLVRSDTSGLPLWTIAVGLLATAICFVPLLTWRSHPDRFPVLGIFGAFQGIYIYMSTVVARPAFNFQMLYPLHVREVGTVATLAYVTALVGAGMVGRRFPTILPSIRRWTSSAPSSIASSSTFRRAGILVIVGIGINRFLPASVTGHLGAIPSILGTARIAGVAIMVLLWCQGSLSRSQMFWTMIAILADAASAASGQFLLYAAVGCVLASLIVLAVKRTHVAVWILLAFMPLALIMNVAKGEARSGTSAHISPVIRLSRLAHYTQLTIAHPTSTALEVSADRFDFAEMLGYIVVHVPRDYPYWNKQSYTDLPFVLVPRAIAPFKPRDTLSNQFGRRYGLLNPNDFRTAANTPIQVEAWANFGGPGLIGIAALVGLLLSAAEGWFDTRRLDGFVLGVVLAYQVMGGVESGITAFALAAPTIIIFIPIVRWALGYSASHRPAGQPPSLLEDSHNARGSAR